MEARCRQTVLNHDFDRGVFVLVEHDGFEAGVELPVLFGTLLQVFEQFAALVFELPLLGDVECHDENQVAVVGALDLAQLRTETAGASPVKTMDSSSAMPFPVPWTYMSLRRNCSAVFPETFQLVIGPAEHPCRRYAGQPFGRTRFQST